MIKPKRIRFDDAITISSNPKLRGKELQKFLKQIKWCENIKVPLTPAILCRDIEKIPNAVEILKELAVEGTIQLELHGWDHEDYGSRSQKEIEEHLEKSFVWFQKKFGTLPSIWMSPHGANSPEMQKAANNFGLILETTTKPVIDQAILHSQLRKTRNLKVLENCVVLNHWWNTGLKLWRIAHIIQYQNVQKAIEMTKKKLNKKEHRIIWNGWNLINV